MIIKTFPDIRALWEGVYFGMLEDRPGYIDHWARNIIHSHQNHLLAKSAIFDFDLGDIGLTPTKWTKFTGQYVDVESLHAWVNNAMNVKGYDALWPFKIVPPNFGGKKAVHQWGPCLLGFSFRRQPGPPTLTFYTRAQSLGFSAVADYALCDFVARKLAERMGISQARIKLQVYCPNLMIKIIDTLHTLHKFGRLDEFLERDTRVSEGIRYYHNYINRDISEIKWRAAKRMRTKYFRSLEGDYRPFPVSSLTIRGWDYHSAQKRLTSQEASELIIAGKGRKGTVEVEDLVLP